MLRFDGADAVKKVVDAIRHFLKSLFINSVMLTCPHFWEIYAVEPHCEEAGCPWREKCPFVEEEVTEKRMTRDVLLRIMSEFDPSAVEE